MAVKKEPQKSNVSKEELLGFYREMLLIRRFEEKAGQLYGMGLIGGFCHLYIGQEAVVVGLEACTKEGDKRITSYRDHGHMLACGMDPKGVMAELTGREGAGIAIEEARRWHREILEADHRRLAKDRRHEDDETGEHNDERTDRCEAHEWTLQINHRGSGYPRRVASTRRDDVVLTAAAAAVTSVIRE